MKRFSKVELRDRLVEKLIEKRNTYQQELLRIQESANEETKSSAGDKYETGRAMAQLEKDKWTKVLYDIKEMLAVVQQLDLGEHSISQWGSVVVTPKAAYFLAIPYGKWEHAEESVFILSPKSPMGAVLVGKRKGDAVEFLKEKWVVEDVF